MRASKRANKAPRKKRIALKKPKPKPWLNKA